MTTNKKRSSLTKLISIALIVFSLLSIAVVPSFAANNGTGTYVISTKAGLNVRSGAGQSYKIVGASPYGTKFIVTKTNGDFGYTSNIYTTTNGYRSGWLNLNYAQKLAEPAPTPQPTNVNYTVVITTKAGLNMRNGPSQNYSVLVAIPYNTYVQITATQDGWGKTSYKGKTGWILLQYTQKVNAPVLNSSISLNVPLYKQGDSRWRNVYIGSKTIGQIGCTTTCIAMVYSYNTGRTYYPNQVKSMLRYSNNDLYWYSISNVNMTRKVYNRYADQSMLNDILYILKQGKPVIIGCNGASRGQHWVVIKGYNGNGLSASNFIINDPGSQNYTNLQQFLNYRGTVYGIVY